ncbi:hypothetical protein KTH71_10085 [Acinetobacter sp. WU_MDCI_Axc73]|nr:hypothetical protein [Acinetobacter sp. WU_MDCI_Axc73]
MLYVIPFIILLVIAVVLKKREASKEEQKPKNKINANKKGKKVAGKSVTRPRSESREVTPTIIAEQKKSTPVSHELHQKIISLIQSGNYSTAEAQINQALNRDNSQHGLYLHLLDIHLLQKDEFAVDQLITHLRALDLNDIVMQAEAKKREYDQQKQPDAIEFSAIGLDFPSTEPTHVEATSSPVISDADFDALVQPVQQNNSISIDHIDSKKQDSAEIEALEFDFSFDQTAKTNEQTPTPTETLSENLTEFSLTLEPREVSNHHIETAQNIDVNFAQESTTDAKLAEPSNLDFSNLDFTSQFALSPENKTQENHQDHQAGALPEFKFDQLELEPTATSLEPIAEPLFSLDQVAEPVTHAPSQFASSFDLNDPLVQSFPELSQVNETQLDLDLATQYVELGAYDSARILLTKNETLFSAEQRELSKNLLNQIAS